jgi:hypothetical protein
MGGIPRVQRCLPKRSPKKYLVKKGVQDKRGEVSSPPIASSLLVGFSSFSLSLFLVVACVGVG